MIVLTDLIGRVAALGSESQRILATHEAAPARIVTLEDTYRRLDQLSLAQEELFRETLRAVEAELYRSAHVLAWAGFMDFLHGHVTAAGLTSISGVRPTWRLKSPEDLRDHADYQVIEAGKEAGFYPKTVMKALHGLLNKRNESAHPSDFFPDFNETLGYVSELFQRIAYLQQRT